jgi:hypothetical protein
MYITVERNRYLIRNINMVNNKRNKQFTADTVKRSYRKLFMKNE